MITAPSAYVAASSTQQVVADWLLELSYDDTAPGTFYMSSAERNVTNFYDGIVLSWGTIDEKLDLANSKASVSDIKITVANKWNNASGLLSNELLGGTKKFINQDVVIRSWLLGCTTTADCLIRYNGRLMSIEHDFETVTFTIEHRQPWDRVKAIRDQVEASLSGNGNTLPVGYVGKMKPVFYGDNTLQFGVASTSMTAAADSDIAPMVFLGVTTAGYHKWLVSDHELEDDPDYLNLWAYDPALDRYVEVLIGGSGVTVVQNSSSGCIISYDPGDVSYKDILYGVGTVSNENNTSPGNWQTDTEAGDSDADTYALSEIEVADATGTKAEIDVDFDQNYAPDRTIAGVEYYAKFRITKGSGLTAGQTHLMFGANDMGTLYSDGADHCILYAVVGGGTIATMKLAETMTHNRDVTGSNTESEARVYEIFKKGSYTTDEVLPLFYGGTGLEFCTWTGGGALNANLMHRVFRDLLFKWSGWDATGINYVQVNGADWNAAGGIDTDRNWLVRWWEDSKKELEEILLQIQFEGCFTWFFDETSSGVEARIDYVKSSYAAGDINATLDGNYLSAVKVSHTPISQIVSKRLANYSRQTLSGEYAEQNTLTNTNRGDFNFGADENVVEDTLDFLFQSADVDSFLAYYDNIVGEPKLIVTADLEDPSNWNLQRGDIVQFSNMEYEPYGQTWSGKYFKITKLQIRSDRFKMTAREVG